MRLFGRRRYVTWLSIATLFVTFLYYYVDLQPKLRARGVMHMRQQRYVQYLVNEQNRSGPGENNLDFPVLSAEEQKLADELFKKEGFNIVISDKIALDRALPDKRSIECKALTYPADLPSVSVIIVYFNEAWSAILRTVHSVVNRTPAEYLHEVILLDDSSTRRRSSPVDTRHLYQHFQAVRFLQAEVENDGVFTSAKLGKQLHDYVRKTWPDGIVRIVRTKERSGLIRARVAGAETATGDVLVFLDAHCETCRGWAEPLLARIKEKPTAVMCPMIDNIDEKTLRYLFFDSRAVGSFNWDLFFKWDYTYNKDQNQRKNTDPYRSPTMAGGLFAMNRNYFFELGAYDMGMEIWGGENLELSFRTWMCGGSLEFHPCSHVGHIFRATHPYGFPSKKGYFEINSARVAEVWMDEYKELFYMEQPKAMLRNPRTNLCLDKYSHREADIYALGLYSCQTSANQVWYWSKSLQIRTTTSCAYAEKASPGSEVTVKRCSGSLQSYSAWLYNSETGQVKLRDAEICFDAEGGPTSQRVKLAQCEAKDTQKWEWEKWLAKENNEQQRT